MMVEEFKVLVDDFSRERDQASLDRLAQGVNADPDAILRSGAAQTIVSILLKHQLADLNINAARALLAELVETTRWSQVALRVALVANLSGDAALMGLCEDRIERGGFSRRDDEAI